MVSTIFFYFLNIFCGLFITFLLSFSCSSNSSSGSSRFFLTGWGAGVILVTEDSLSLFLFSSKFLESCFLLYIALSASPLSLGSYYGIRAGGVFSPITENTTVTTIVIAKAANIKNILPPHFLYLYINYITIQLKKVIQQDFWVLVLHIRSLGVTTLF